MGTLPTPVRLKYNTTNRKIMNYVYKNINNIFDNF